MACKPKQPNGQQIQNKHAKGESSEPVQQTPSLLGTSRANSLVYSLLTTRQGSGLHDLASKVDTAFPVCPTCGFSQAAARSWHHVRVKLLGCTARMAPQRSLPRNGFVQCVLTKPTCFAQAVVLSILEARFNVQCLQVKPGC